MAAFQRRIIQEATKRQLNALIRELAVDVGFYYLALMEACVQNKNSLSNTLTH